jgi:hypothetical protein
MNDPAYNGIDAIYNIKKFTEETINELYTQLLIALADKLPNFYALFTFTIQLINIIHNI